MNSFYRERETTQKKEIEGDITTKYRKREKYRDRERQIERQATDRRTDRQTNRETDGGTQTEAFKQRDRLARGELLSCLGWAVLLYEYFERKPG